MRSGELAAAEQKHDSGLVVQLGCIHVHVAQLSA
jgi:hypothetical protein